MDRVSSALQGWEITISDLLIKRSVVCHFRLQNNGKAMEFDIDKDIFSDIGYPTINGGSWS